MKRLRSPGRTRTGRTRRGFTLRELTLAISIGSVVAATAVGLVHRAFDWSTLARHRRADDQTCYLLGRQLRNDVRIAENATLSPTNDAPQTLELDHAGTSVVTYSIEESGISRIETTGEAVVHRENYRFKRARQVSFSIDETDQQVSLRIATITPDQSATPIWRLIRASVGLRLRHQQGDIER